jgi:5-methylthioadenosine/S-adenosylhomocysteine deaminase
MIEALKFGVLVPKAVAEDPRAFNARDSLRLATVGGAKAVGLSADMGALEVGRLADLFVFDPLRLKSVPVHDPISALVYTGSQSNVDTVVIDGRVVLEHGEFTTIDEEALVREVNERALALSQRVGTFRLTRGRRFTPFSYDAPAVGAPAAAAADVEPAPAHDESERVATAVGDPG